MKKNKNNIYENVTNSEEAKIKGNDFFTKKSYKKAYKLYTKAIELTGPETPLEKMSIYFSNRSQASIYLNKYSEAITDCDSSLRYDSSNFKALYRKLTCHVRLNDIEAAEEIIEKLRKQKPEVDLSEIVEELANNIANNINKGKKRKDSEEFDKNVVSPLYPGEPLWIKDPSLIPKIIPEIVLKNIKFQRDLDLRWAHLCALFNERSKDYMFPMKEIKEIYKIAGLKLETKLDDKYLINQRDFVNSHNVASELLDNYVKLSQNFRRCNECESYAIFECICGEIFCSKECQIKGWQNHMEACEIVQDNNKISSMLTRETWGKNKEILENSENDDYRKQLRSIIAKSTNLKLNDSDLYGNGDQSKIIHFPGTSGQDLIEVWSSGADYNPMDSNMAKSYPQFYMHCFYGNYDNVLAILSDAENISLEHIRKILDKRVSLLRFSALMFCISGASMIDSFPIESKKLARHLDVTKLLIKYGADINAKDLAGYSCIHQCTTSASNQHKLKIGLLLIEYNVDCNARTRAGSLPIYEPIMYQRKDCLRVLCEGGCDPNINDENNLSGMKLARMWKEGTEILLETSKRLKEAKINKESNNLLLVN